MIIGVLGEQVFYLGLLLRFESKSDVPSFSCEVLCVDVITLDGVVDSGVVASYGFESEESAYLCYAFGL